MSDTIESTVMAEPEASSSSAILTGMKRGFPIFLGYVPLGFAYGVLAVQNNIPAVYAVLFSLLVPQCKERLYTLAAVLSALLSVILAMYDTGRWNVIIASVITSTIGALLVTHRDRNIDALRRKA